MKILCKELSNITICETLTTKHKAPWKFVFLQELPTKRQALIREKVLKKNSQEQVGSHISSDNPSLYYFTFSNKKRLTI